MRITEKKGLHVLGLAGLMLIVPALTFAQSSNNDDLTVVSGVVTDAALGTPMAGVRVQAYNNPSHSAMTKEDGSYSIRIPDYVSSLVFSVEGSNRAVCALNGRTEGVDMVMYSDVFSEIYNARTTGTRSKDLVVDYLNADLSIDDQIQKNLQGDIMGTIRSGQLGMGASMLINGINSLNINTQPLIVIDGVIMDMGYDKVFQHDGFYNNLLANVMVEDIESVSVLKNGYALYGAKGANGVIVINTKRNKSMATKIDLSIAGNYQLVPKFPAMMDASQYRSYVSEMIGSTDTKLNTFKFLSIDKQYHYYNTYHNETDWTEVAYRNAFIQNYSMNVDGGDDIAKYTLSVGFAKGDGTLKESDYQRFNLRLNSDIVLADKLLLRFDASYSDVTRDMRDDGIVEDVDNDMITSPGFLSLVKSPFLSPYALSNQGNITTAFLADADDYLDELLGDEASLSNPLSILENANGINKNYFGNRLITLSITPTWEYSRYLKFKEHFSYTLVNSDENYFIPIEGTPHFELEGLGEVDNKVASMNSKYDGFMSNTYFDYARRFKAHDVALQGGFRYINNALTQSSMSGYNSGNDKTPNMTPDLKYPLINSLQAKDISLTWWAVGDYNFKERYYLSAGLSLMASSRFGGKVSNGIKIGVPWGVFPSVQAGWVASAEPWFNVKAIDYLKLNAGFDLTGNDGFDDAASRTYFAPVKVLQMSGLAIDNIGNTSLQWETVSKLSAGLDMNMFRNRASLSLYGYMSTTDNLLSISSLSEVTGVRNAWSNGGTLKNTGFDATLSGKLVNTNMVKWELGASIGKYKTEITKLPDDAAITLESYGATLRTEVGGPISVFYGYKTDGVFSTAADAERELQVQVFDEDGDPVYEADGVTPKYVNEALHMRSDRGINTYFEAGDVKFIDMNGDAIINEKDMVKIGDPNPDFYGRLFTNLNVKNLTLSATMTYKIGGDVYNYQRMILESGSRFMNQTLAVTNHWTCEGQVTDYPKLVYGDPHQNSRFSDRWIEDGSYLRLKNVTLSYRIPVVNEYLHGITVWCAGNNLLTLTRYLGSDPEFSLSNNAYTMGIDRGLVPQSRNFSLGIKINL
ncbi:MAG: SusC/RagA family TonB-linked outer membrane protein [Bacteroidaceae bacterium]|nr:SusC/RagA family TonB-linked outer membrane protein [Bacteroidaceae bacterium]